VDARPGPANNTDQAANATIHRIRGPALTTTSSTATRTFIAADPSCQQFRSFARRSSPASL
jgi:hypothetical protein